MSASEPDRTVIMGVGNTLMQDDGVGVHVARRLRELPLDSSVEIIEAGTMAAQSLGGFDSIRSLVIVDAMDADGPPGALYRVPASQIPPAKASISVHHLSLADALATWRLQGMDLRRVVVMGIQPGETEFTEGLTDAVKRRLPKICRAVAQEASSSTAGMERTIADDDCQQAEADRTGRQLPRRPRRRGRRRVHRLSGGM